LVTSIERIHDVYKLDEKIIGSGSFGHIRIARNLQTGMKVAIKTIKKDKIKD
jgi:serine/threonine protein kinase